MKLNQLILLGATACFAASIPVVSHAIAADSPARSVSPARHEIAQNQSVAVASGTFIAGEKPTTGTARIVSEGGHRYLELDAAFSTSNQGPDLHVLLDPTEQPPKTYSNQGSTVNLGKLHEYSGAQRYPIPDALDLANFNSVVIWCRMANATFGYAPLTPTSNARIQ